MSSLIPTAARCVARRCLGPPRPDRAPHRSKEDCRKSSSPAPSPARLRCASSASTGRVASTAPGVSFSPLWNQYQRTILPGATASYHFTDWIGVSIFGGYGIPSTTGLRRRAPESSTAVTAPNKPFTKACRLTAVNLTHGKVADDRFGNQWVLAPQVQVVPFRGKSRSSRQSSSTPMSEHLRRPHHRRRSGAHLLRQGRGGRAPSALPAPNQKSFALAGRIAVAPTFGLGLNLYPNPTPFLGFGFDIPGRSPSRGTPRASTITAAATTRTSRTTTSTALTASSTSTA